ncbi:MAG: DNA polymerase III subunit delta' [Alphaproteobacteria bacterium]|jgi:DNA polymerase III subunit delta'|nr:DNA polymerase III subunit delta' [Alphaproteobacteria bacterium]MBT4085441.1 DNA polymerase III subunit delta' [Alphaproteobacteria bacterium]
MATQEDNEEDHPFAPWRNLSLSGHGAAESTFLKAWNSGRMPHAWLVTGPKGVGKSTFAYRCGRFVLAQNGKDQEAGLFGAPPPPETLEIPEDDPVVPLVAQQGHPSLRRIARSWDDKSKKTRGEIVVDDVRKAIKIFNVTAGEGAWRIVIVDAVDEMNPNAANALLKTLEEPPERSLLILIAHNPGRLLPTIRSRCRTLPLKPLDEHDVANLLAQRAVDADQQGLLSLARLADGSPGKALDLMESGGHGIYEDLIGLLKPLPDLDIPALHKFADRMARKDAADQARAFMALLDWWLARMIRHAALGQVPADIVSGDGQLSQSLAARRSLDQWIEVWEKITRLATRADSVYLDRKQVLLNVFSMLEKAARA